MNYNETLEYIHSLGMFSHPAGLERINRLLNALDNPQNKFPAIHIAGTNGKGSISVMVASALQKEGYRVGLFTSPYIVNFRERITVNGEYIPEDDLCRLAKKVIATNIAVTEFEFITAVGFLYVAEMNCDIVLAETGLGGRLDATNTLNSVALSVIAKIGLDHTAILGNTIEEIAREKCGIIKNNKVVTVGSQPENALRIIKEFAPEVIIPDSPQKLSTDISGNTFIYKGEKFSTSLLGEFQIENAAAAIEVLQNCGFKISLDSIKWGIKNAFIPARMEIISKTPLIILDGAHNPDGAKVLSRFMEAYSGKITALIGVMKDKDYKEVLFHTLKHCKSVVCVTPNNLPRALKGAELMKEAKEYCSDVICANTILEGLEMAKVKTGTDTIVIFGSLYLASNIRNLIFCDN